MSTMAKQKYSYIIVGGGLAGASAAEEIRQHDKNGSILLIGSENALPYHRPPLSKKLWTGQKKLEDIFIKSQDFYDSNGIDIAQGTTIVALDAIQKMVEDGKGKTYFYDKLFLIGQVELYHY